VEYSRPSEYRASFLFAFIFMAEMRDGLSHSVIERTGAEQQNSCAFLYDSSRASDGVDLARFFDFPHSLFVFFARITRCERVCVANIPKVHSHFRVRSGKEKNEMSAGLPRRERVYARANASWRNLRSRWLSEDPNRSAHSLSDPMKWRKA
jgi:hypothetical protein